MDQPLDGTSIPIQRAPRINEQWLQLIAATADASTGLRLVAEPVEVPILLRSAG